MELWKTRKINKFNAKGKSRICFNVASRDVIGANIYIGRKGGVKRRLFRLISNVISCANRFLDKTATQNIWIFIMDAEENNFQSLNISRLKKIRNIPLIRLKC